MSTVSTSEVSSSSPVEPGLELGLGLSLGGGGGKSKSGVTSESADWGKYARILTAKDFPSMGGVSNFVSSSRSPSSLSSSSSSSSYLTRANFPATEPASPPSNNGVSNQVVGWPPIRAYRMNSMVNQAKCPPTEEFQSTVKRCKSNIDDVDMNNSEQDDACIVKEIVQPMKRKFNFVKVNMDGNGIGRKVDLSAHSCYETLAQTIEDMFSGATPTRSSVKECDVMIGATGSSKLLDGSSEFVLTYEDKDGDWMLVGDVPWRMFINSVKRLRIMRTSEASGIGQECKTN